MNRNRWLLVLCVVCLLLFASGQKRENEPDAVAMQRYALVNAQQEQEGKIVFMLDTRTGSVWKYQAAAAPSGNRKYLPETFIRVGFGLPVEGVLGNGLKGSAAEDSAH